MPDLSGCCNGFMRGLWLFITSISVEPACLLFSASGQIFKQVSDTAIYERICRDHYPDADCWDPGHGLSRSQQIVVQSEKSNWDMYNGVAGIALGCPALILWSAWADINGRKIIMMVSICGGAFTCWLYTIICVNDNVPLWIMPVGILLIGTTGSTVLFFNAAIQYTADIVKDKKSLTIRVMIVLTCLTAGGLIGGMSTPIALKKGVGFGTLLLAAQALYVPTAIYIFLVIKQVRPTNRARRSTVRKNTEGPEGSDPDPEQPPKSTKAKKESVGLMTIVKLVRDVWKVYTRPREGRKRLYCLLALLGFFLYGTEFGGDLGHLLSSYVFKSPLSFTLTEYVTFLQATAFLSFIGNIVIAGVVTKLLHWPDTFLIVLSVTGGTIQMIIYGVSRVNWMIWLGGCVGAFSFVGLSALQTLFAWLVDPTELGIMIAGFGVAQQISALLSDVIYPQIYRATIRWYPGFTFLITAVMVFMSFSMFMFIHLDLWRQNFLRHEREGGEANGVIESDGTELGGKELGEANDGYDASDTEEKF